MGESPTDQMQKLHKRERRFHQLQVPIGIPIVCEQLSRVAILYLCDLLLFGSANEAS